MAKQYRKKPVVIEAKQFTGENSFEIAGWAHKGKHPAQQSIVKVDLNGGKYLMIHTLEGDMIANINDWIIKGVNGEFYPCKNEIFLKTYEPVEEQQ